MAFSHRGLAPSGPGLDADQAGREEQLPAFAEKSFAIGRLMRVNPRAPTPEDLLEILRSAF